MTRREAPLRRLLVPLALWALAACATEPPGPALVGTFGGPGVGLIATDTAAQFLFACERGVTGPLRLRGAGAYRASGSIVPRLFALPPAETTIEARASLAGDRVLDLLLTYTSRSQNPDVGWSAAYKLVRGAAPDFSNIVCAALSEGEKPPS